MRPASTIALPRHSYTAHLRALHRDGDDADEHHERLSRHSEVDNSQLDTSKDDSDRSSLHSLASTDSIDRDQPYYTLLASLTQSDQPLSAHFTDYPPPTITATLPIPLWPLACDIFDRAERLHRLSHSPTRGGVGLFSFLNLLTAHTDITTSKGLSSSSTSLLFSFLVALHRLSLQLGEERVDWWRLLQAAWVRQCRTDEELRWDEGVRRRLEDKRRLTATVDDFLEVKEDGRPSVLPDEWQGLQAAEEVKQLPTRPLQRVEESAPASRKRKYNPLSSAAIELLNLNFHAWRTYTTEQRQAPEVVSQAHRFHCHTVWQQWRMAWLLHKADKQRLRVDRQLLDHALHVWTKWWERRRLSHAAVRLAHRHCQLVTQSQCLNRWLVALQDVRDERHQLRTASQHHQQFCLPVAIQRWQQFFLIKRRLHSDATKVKAWRRKRLAMETVAVWRQTLQGAIQYQKDAAVRLRPLRLRQAVLEWQQTVKSSRSTVVSSGPFLHAAFRWLQRSFNQPPPFTTTPSSSSLIVRPSRQHSHSAMQQLWQRWQLQRFHTAWRHDLAQHKIERVKLSHIQRLHSRQLLETAWQRWKHERQRRVRRKTHALRQALGMWYDRARQRRARREQLLTAALVDKFNTQRYAFRLWVQHWLQCEQHRREKHRQEREQQQREEHDAAVERQMQQQADSFYHNSILSLSIMRWHSYAVRSLVTTCTLTLASTHHSIVCKQWALQRWREWQQQCKQHQAEQQQLADRADVMYVGRLLSVMLVCWRVQLVRKRALRLMSERREQRQLHERWQRWRLYVQLCQQQRREQRAEEERLKREDDQRKGQIVVRGRMRSAWAVWRSRIAVVCVGQQLFEKRSNNCMQRVMRGWWAAVQQKRRLAEVRRLKLEQLLHAYVKQRQDAENRSLKAEIVVRQRAQRRRLAAVFTVWRGGGLRRLNERRHDAVRGEQSAARHVLREWRTTVQQRKEQLGKATVAFEHRAGTALLAATFETWRHTLYLRSVHEQVHGIVDEDEAGLHIAAFTHWRRRCMSDAWERWRSEVIERRIDGQAETRHRAVAAGRAVSRWSASARRTKQQRLLGARSQLNDERRVFSQWRQALAMQRQERRAAESLQFTLTATSLPFIRPLLLSILRPQLPSRPSVDWFRCWRAYVAHRKQRLEMMTAAYQLYHHNLLASAFVLMLAECRMAAHTTTSARSLTQHRLSAALHRWHQHTEQRHTARTVAELSSAHHSSRLVSNVLSAWRQQCKSDAVRRSRCAEVERGVDALVVRGAFQRWRTAAVGERRRQRMFSLSHCFLLWKWQTRRLRERRQLLQADNKANVPTLAVAVRVVS